jgi:replication factor C small subunit
MESPLWIERHAPAIDDLPQPHVRDVLHEAADEPLNVLLYGPSGAGKTAAARALGRAAHATPDSDVVTVNVADFFDLTKSELTDDPRFEAFLSGHSDLTKRDMMRRILRETASYRPVSGDYKTVILDDAGAMREDFQQALRRVMEQYHEATRFVIATRQPNALIPPIRSRAVPVAVRSPTPDEIDAAVERILEREDVFYDADALQFLATYADGNLRQAITLAQTATALGDGLTTDSLSEATDATGDDRYAEALEAAAAGEFTDARSTLDDLLDEVGGDAALDGLLDAARDRYTGDELARVYRFAGRVDLDRAAGDSDRVHLGHLLAERGAVEAGSRGA